MGFVTIPEEERQAKWEEHQKNGTGFLDNTFNMWDDITSPLRKGSEAYEESQEGSYTEPTEEELADELLASNEYKYNPPTQTTVTTPDPDYSEMEKLSMEARKREDEYRNSLMEKTEASQKALDSVLASLIDQTGYSAGLSKQAIASQQAGQGLLRTGQTGSRLQGVDIAEMAGKADLRSKAETQRRSIADSAGESIKSVNERRKGIEQQMKIAELKGQQSLDFQEAQLNIKMEFDTLINDMQIAASAKQDLQSIIASLGYLGGAYVGYNQNNPTTGSTTTSNVGANDIATNIA